MQVPETKSPMVAVAPTITVLWSRTELIAFLSDRVSSLEKLGVSHRAAIRSVASDVGLHPMRVRRLVDLYPEA